jgi:hypothetical protein
VLYGEYNCLLVHIDLTDHPLQLSQVSITALRGGKVFCWRDQPWGMISQGRKGHEANSLWLSQSLLETAKRQIDPLLITDPVLISNKHAMASLFLRALLTEGWLSDINTHNLY